MFLPPSRPGLKLPCSRSMCVSLRFWCGMVLKPLQYTVALFAPAAAGLVLKDESARQGKNARMLLHVMRVGVASLHPKGVRPLPITPPSYVQPEPWPTSSSYIY
jgi:hypothetical protein